MNGTSEKDVPRAREGHVDEKGGHGGAVPAAFGESTVWRSVLLGARATVSAKAAAGNLLATANRATFSFVSRLRAFVPSFLPVYLATRRDILFMFFSRKHGSRRDAFSRLFQR